MKILSIFASKKNRNFVTILNFAKELEQKLNWVPNTQNGMDRIVEFFQIVSSVQDKVLELTKGRKQEEWYKDQKKKRFIQDFTKFLYNSGRSVFGWNRTNQGETPTPNNVWINMKVPYDELFKTRRVADYLSRRNNPKGEVDYALKEDRLGKWNETGLIEHEFVNPFMKNNYKFLQQILREL